MYQLILLQSCDYLQKISIKINVGTDKVAIHHHQQLVTCLHDDEDLVQNLKT